MDFKEKSWITYVKPSATPHCWERARMPVAQTVRKSTRKPAHGWEHQARYRHASSQGRHRLRKVPEFVQISGRTSICNQDSLTPKPMFLQLTCKPPVNVKDMKFRFPINSDNKNCFLQTFLVTPYSLKILFLTSGFVLKHNRLFSVHTCGPPPWPSITWHLRLNNLLLLSC